MIVRFTMMFESHPKDGRRIEFFRGAGLSGPDSLLAGKLTGNFAHLAPFRQMRLSTGGQDQWFASKFPTMRAGNFSNRAGDFLVGARILSAPAGVSLTGERRRWLSLSLGAKHARAIPMDGYAEFTRAIFK
jgi:hypothetical protein